MVIVCPCRHVYFSVSVTSSCTSPSLPLSLSRSRVLSLPPSLPFSHYLTHSFTLTFSRSRTRARTSETCEHSQPWNLPEGQWFCHTCSAPAGALPRRAPARRTRNEEGSNRDGGGAAGREGGGAAGRERRRGREGRGEQQRRRRSDNVPGVCVCLCVWCMSVCLCVCARAMCGAYCSWTEGRLCYQGDTSCRIRIVVGKEIMGASRPWSAVRPSRRV